jgi:outer membrane protein OmpA-like peptidoglycan-associated protein
MLVFTNGDPMSSYFLWSRKAQRKRDFNIKGEKMKRILTVLLVVGLTVMGTSVVAPAEQEIDFYGLLKGEKIVSPAGIFETGKAEFGPRLTGFLDRLANFLGQNPGLVVEVGGHADSSGTPQQNERLSLSRAQLVQQYLKEKSGIPEERIVVKGYAAQFPIADNRTPEGRARNRRVEIVAVKSVDPAGRLTYIRRDVLTKSQGTLDFIRASLNQGLFHLDRVLTRTKSNANVTFQDLSRLNLGPQSLMIMYALLEREFRLPRQQNIHLLTGGLRTKLNRLKGALQVQTPSCVINADSVEVLVGIDQKKKSAVSVFDGKSEVAAQGKSVEVAGGYGTVVEMGEPPAPPEPLPPAPQLQKPMDTEIPVAEASAKAAVLFQWAGLEPSYHLQVAADSEFEQILEDEILQQASAALSLGVGTYYWRAAAISKRGLEGYAASSSFTITASPDLPLQLTPAPEAVVKTFKPGLTVSGKTVPGAQVTVNGQAVQVDGSGGFAAVIRLKTSWNDIEIRANHPEYAEKKVFIRAYRYDLCETSLRLSFRYGLSLSDGELDNVMALQLGKPFCLSPYFDSEIAVGLAKMSWQNFPGDYEQDMLAIPLTAEVHVKLGKGITKPYLTAGMTAYIAFPQRRFQDKTDTRFFLSPEVGGGLTFPIFGYPTRFEVKYSLFPKKAPFMSELGHVLTFILKWIFY